jgi:tetratricopeptide (TPR) repeat protein
MSNRKAIKSKQQSHAGLELEKSGDQKGAVKLYQKATKTDPLNEQAWNRQMILYRKSKSREEEIALIKTAIAVYKKQAATIKKPKIKATK